MKNSKHLVIGYGEVGVPIFKILESHYNVQHYDIEDSLDEDVLYGKFDVLHICFPHSPSFMESVEAYQEEFLEEGGLTIIHSTVPVGTSTQLGAVHSPVIGQHPRLYDFISRFPKIFGGMRAHEAAMYWYNTGRKIVIYDKEEESEAAKLFLTEYTRDLVEFCNRVKKYCDLHSLNFSNVYRIPNWIFNDGYKEFGREEFTHAVLEPLNPYGEIGGHCIVPNSKLIALSEHGYEK